MLKGISPLISPELLDVMMRMGHGDDLVFADAHFPGETMGKRVVRADGLTVTQLVSAVLPIFELDSYSPPLSMMAAVPGDELDPSVEAAYMDAVLAHVPDAKSPQRIERFAFYERAQKAFAVVMTSETAKYGNLILTKGVTPSA